MITKNESGDQIEVESSVEQAELHGQLREEIRILNSLRFADMRQYDLLLKKLELERAKLEALERIHANEISALHKAHAEKLDILSMKMERNKIDPISPEDRANIALCSMCVSLGQTAIAWATIGVVVVSVVSGMLS